MPSKSTVAKLDIAKGSEKKSAESTLMSHELFYVFVDMEPADPICNVIPSQVVERCVRGENRRSLVAPEKNDLPYKETQMRRVLPRYSYKVDGLANGCMNEYCENWEQLDGVD